MHVCNEQAFFEDLVPVHMDLIVEVVENSVAVNQKRKIKARDNDQNCNFKFHDVMMVNLKSPVNLVSVVRLLELSWIVKELTEIWILDKNSFELRGKIYKHDLWVLFNKPILPFKKPCVAVILSSGIDDTEITWLSLRVWHERIAHQNFNYMKDIMKRFEIEYEKLPKDFKCKDCVKGKMSELPFNECEKVATTVRDLTHADLMISPILSLGNSKYALCLKDDFSKFRSVYFLKKKNDTLDCFCDYFSRIEIQTGKKPKNLRTDNGTEKLDTNIEELTSTLGIIYELTVHLSLTKMAKSKETCEFHLKLFIRY